MFDNYLSHSKISRKGDSNFYNLLTEVVSDKQRKTDPLILFQMFPVQEVDGFRVLLIECERSHPETIRNV